jgi:ATP-dependent RNA helicase RhlE
LKQSGIHADALHGNKSQSARQRTLDDFKAFRTHVLVATDIASRGIDVEGISHVLNYDLPHEPETYVHRIGRTGRAGASGIAVSLCDDEERKHLQAIERLLRRALPVQAPPSGGGQARTATRTQRQPQASQSQGNARPHRGQPGRKAPGKGTRGHGGGYRPHQKPRRADRRRTARTA